MSENVRVPALQLRPSELTADVEYMRTPEEVGLMLDRTNQIALFTARGAPSIGLQGPPGEDRNSWYDTIIASASDEFTPITPGAQSKTTFRAPYPLKMDTPGYPGRVRASLTVAPEGAPMTVRITVNGQELLSPPLQIDSGSRTSVGSVVEPTILVNEIPDDAEFIVYVDSVGTVFAGSGLKVAVTGIKNGW